MIEEKLRMKDKWRMMKDEWRIMKDEWRMMKDERIMIKIMIFIISDDKVMPCIN